MAANLVKAGHQVTGFDVVPRAVDALASKGGRAAATAAEAAAAGEMVITMLPAGPEVRSVYHGENGVLANARKGALLIDCSTIDVETARAVATAAAEAVSWWPWTTVAFLGFYAWLDVTVLWLITRLFHMRWRLAQQ